MSTLSGTRSINQQLEYRNHELTIEIEIQKQQFEILNQKITELMLQEKQKQGAGGTPNFFGNKKRQHPVKDFCVETKLDKSKRRK